MSNAMNYYLSAPINVTLKITNACNLNCLHCHSKSGFSHHHMDDEMLFDIIRQLRESKVFGINISGGEPLLHPGFFDIVKQINDSGMRVTVSTNAVLINEDVAAQMIQSDIQGAHVSLDGSSADVHDQIRNSTGCFEKAVAGIKALLKQGIAVMVVTVISSQTPEEYERIIDFACELGAQAHKTNALMPMGNAKENIDLLKDRFLLDYAEVWKRKKEQYRHKMEIKGEMGFLMQIGEEFYYEKKGPKVLNIGCSAGLTTCSILEDGKVTLCSFCPEVVCGDLTKNTFKDIWNQSEVLLKIRRREEFEGCNQCESVNHCGGCRIRALYHHNLYGVDPYCWKFKQELNKG